MTVRVLEEGDLIRCEKDTVMFHLDEFDKRDRIPYDLPKGSILMVLEIERVYRQPETWIFLTALHDENILKVQITSDYMTNTYVVRDEN